MEVGPEQFDDPLFRGDVASRMHAWCEISARADAAGRVLLSVRELAPRWNWGRTKVSEFLALLASENSGRLQLIERTNNGSFYQILVSGNSVRRTPQADTPGHLEADTPKTGRNRGRPPKSEDPTLFGADTENGCPADTSSGHQQTNGKPANKNKLKDPEKPETYSSEVQRLTDLLWKLGLSSLPGFTGRIYAKQANMIKRMIEASGPEMVESAIRGARRIFPFNKEDRPPFDAFQVDKRIVEAAAAWQVTAHQREEATARKSDVAAIDNQRHQKEADYKALTDAWEHRIKTGMKAMPDAELEKIRQNAERQVDALPGKDARDEKQKKKLTRAFAMVIYGQQTKDPPPPRPR